MINGHSSPHTCYDAPLGPSLAEACNSSTFLVFMSLLNSCVRTNEKISGICERIEPVEIPDDEYDFIVIGGGTAGSVVAARLSEIPEWKVLLIEAGPDEPAGAEIPSLASQFLEGESEVVWNYATRNESHACLADNGTCAWPSGRNLGGDAAHNFMIYVRGNPTDYNNWAAAGNVGWTYEEVEPFFKMAENNREIERVGRVHHATGGPVSVERFPYIPDMGYSILAAAEEVGYPLSNDINGDQITGFTIIQSMTKNGVRDSSAAAYLRPIRKRRNLHVSLNSFATKIIIEDKKAVGVEYYKDNKRKRVRVTREVVVSGGAMRSPHLLLISGIGPKKHLKSVGAKVIKDLPGVGENFHDHLNTIMYFTINKPDVFDNNYKVAAQYLNSQTGPMSSMGLGQVTGILASRTTTPDYPDVQVLLVGYIASCAPGEINALRSTGGRTIAIAPTYLHPKSRGRVSLASKNPFDYPVLWANYMGEPSDVDRIVDAIKMNLALLDTDALRSYNFTLSTVSYEACSDFEFLTDEYLACAAQQITYPLYHHAGSCKMGPASDTMAVVDPRLRVHGIKGLRVADASIMPKVTSGNTAAPTIMIGERGADFIKRDWGRKSDQRIRKSG